MATWDAQPKDVGQGPDHEDFVRAQGSGSVLAGGHLNYVVAVPVLPPDGRAVLGCVALDVPPRDLSEQLSEGHYIIEGLRAIADSLGSPRK